MKVQDTISTNCSRWHESPLGSDNDIARECDYPPEFEYLPFTPIIPDLVKLFLACAQNITISTFLISMNKSNKARVMKVLR